MSDLDELLRGGAASWLLSAAMRDLKRRTNDGLPWPPSARAVVDELARLADLPAPQTEMSASGPATGSLVPVSEGWAPVAAAAQIVGRDPRHVRRLAADGKIRCRRVGARAYLVDVDSLRSVLRRAS